MSLLGRVQLRLNGEPRADDTALLQELCDLAEVRICLRIREPTLPDLMEPIAADAVVKIWRRWNYEGVSSESGESISTSFVEDILAEYDDEFQAYAEQKASASGKKVVHFL